MKNQKKIHITKMNREFKGKIFTTARIVFLLLTVVMLSLYGLIIFPKIEFLQQQFPNNPSVLQTKTVINMTFFGAIFAALFSFLIIVFNVKNKKITIDKNLLIFSNKSILGNTQIQMIPLNTISHIGYRKLIRYFFAGKGIIPIIHYWLVFENQDGKKEEILIDWLDRNTIKEVLLYIKEKFPKITLDTHVLRDSSEKLSGVEDFLEKHKNHLDKKA